MISAVRELDAVTDGVSDMVDVMEVDDDCTLERERYVKLLDSEIVQVLDISPDFVIVEDFDPVRDSDAEPSLVVESEGVFVDEKEVDLIDVPVTEGVDDSVTEFVDCSVALRLLDNSIDAELVLVTELPDTVRVGVKLTLRVSVTDKDSVKVEV